MADERTPMAARTPDDIRLAIMHSTDSSRILAQRYGINQKTVLKWRRRNSCADVSSRPKRLKPRALTQQEEEIALGFRVLTELPLDDCLYALRAAIPNLARSTLHRFLARNDAGRIAQSGSEDAHMPPLSGDLRSGILGGRAQDLGFLAFVAIDVRTRLFFGRIYDMRDDSCIQDFMQRLEAFLPYAMRSISFRDRRNRGNTGAWAYPSLVGSADRLTWHANYRHEREALLADAQVEPSAPTAELDPRPSFYESVTQAQSHMNSFALEYNLSRRLKSLGGATPAQCVRKLVRTNALTCKTKDPIRHLANQLSSSTDPHYSSFTDG